MTATPMPTSPVLPPAATPAEPSREPPWAPAQVRAAIAHWMRTLAPCSGVADAARAPGLDVEGERARPASGQPAPGAQVTEAGVLDELDAQIAVALGRIPLDVVRLATALRLFAAVEQLRSALDRPRVPVARTTRLPPVRTVLIADAVFDGVADAIRGAVPAWAGDLLVRVEATATAWRCGARIAGPPVVAATQARERLIDLGLCPGGGRRHGGAEVAIATEWRALEVEVVLRIRQRAADGAVGEEEFLVLSELVATLAQLGGSRTGLMEVARAATAS